MTNENIEYYCDNLENAIDEIVSAKQELLSAESDVIRLRAKLIDLENDLRRARLEFAANVNTSETYQALNFN